MLEQILTYAREFLQGEFEDAHKLLQKEMNDFLSGTNIPYGVRLDNA